MGAKCVEKVLGSSFFDSRIEFAWHYRLYDSLKESNRQEFQINELENKCSKYISILRDKSSESFYIRINNYPGAYPAIFADRSFAVGCSVGIPVFIMAILFGLRKWLS